jgi:DNA segregation ATPase FtsK/SpoIIIE, S-DNA-T family
MRKIKDLIHRQRIKGKLLDCFHSAEIYRTVKRDQNIRYIYPSIISVKKKENENKTEVVFVLKNGLDPKSIKKKEFVFQQYFGKQIEIKGDIKKFVLNIYHNRLTDNLIYNFDVIQHHLNGKLPILCGKNSSGKWRSFDLTKHPHLLVAGETGSGKSSMLRNILTTLIKVKSPSELHLYLADCKKSEFSIFRNVEHVKCVVNKASDIKKMLVNIQQELDKRSDLTDQYEVSHIDDLPEEERRPYIIVCIDEFVMLRKDELIMNILTEIVAIGRTLGVFAILSMQRPSSDILDTSIRANLTVRMGFKVADKTNAKIINTEGAENIEQVGRFKLRITNLEEIQSPYLSMEKAKELLESYKVKKVEQLESMSEEKDEQPIFGVLGDENAE